MLDIIKTLIIQKHHKQMIHIKIKHSILYKRKMKGKNCYKIHKIVIKK